MLYYFFTAPLWSAYTKAIARNDYAWIKRITKKMLFLAYILSLVIIILFTIYQPVVKFWLRGKVDVPVLLSLIMALSIIIRMLIGPFVKFINGSGKLKINLRLANITVLLNIPLSIIFAKPLGMGIAGVIFATVVCNFISLIFSTIQYYKIVYQRSTGIWNE